MILAAIVRGVPGSEYLSAFDTRLIRTCRTRPSSAITASAGEMSTVAGRIAEVGGRWAAHQFRAGRMSPAHWSPPAPMQTTSRSAEAPGHLSYWHPTRCAAGAGQYHRWSAHVARAAPA